jgi:hypothetical protein
VLNDKAVYLDRKDVVSPYPHPQALSCGKNTGFSGCLQLCISSHVIKLKRSSQLIGQFGHVTASAVCKQLEKHGKGEEGLGELIT